MRAVLETEHFSLVFDEAHNILRLARTSAPFVATLGAEPEVASVQPAMATFDPHAVALLIDLRAAPPRNDEGFEATMDRAKKRLFGRFDHSAMLVRTAVGRLQVTRLGGGGGPRSFLGEEEAVAYLRDALATGSKGPSL